MDCMQTSERDTRGTKDKKRANEKVRAGVWKPMSLATLFRVSDTEKPRARKPSRKAMEEEELMMQPLSEQVEDDILDNGAMEIDSDEEFHPALSYV
ncbi:hypothetical protein B0H14DRAFT_3464534 [Mycena olivaceomarginata]|nr:hypothetical protein B0H14DRAFT_3464534 [Mycena olivaceomarginata]